MMKNSQEKEIQEALIQVESIVKSANNESDLDYFNFHKKRYHRMAKSIVGRVAKGASILNIGSHYLHTSLLFKFLGYEIHSMDVQVFWELDFVSDRVKEYKLTCIVDNDLESFESHRNISNKYDVVLFAEILEHITFNPVLFWKMVYEITRENGYLYISTPNSLNLYNIARTFARIFTFRGIGIPIGSIFQNVTYGHHWKEYSVSEIKKYFNILSDDFKVKTFLYHYRKPEFSGFYATLISIFSLIGNSLYVFSDEIEVLVEVKKTGSWKIESPEY